MARSGRDLLSIYARPSPLRRLGFVLSALVFALASVFVNPSAASVAGAANADDRVPAAPVVSFATVQKTADVQKRDFGGGLHPVRARLVADRDQVAPGETFRLGVHLEQAPGWHTYWKSPGEFGQPVEIQWTFPLGWTHTEYEFPVPSQFDEDGIYTYGYDDQVLFFVEVTLPVDQARVPVEVAASVQWVVCAELCIPGDAELKSTLGVTSSGSGPNGFTGLFDYYAGLHPTPVAELEQVTLDAATSMDGVRPGDAFQLAIRATPRGGVSFAAPTVVGAWPAFAPIVNFSGMFLGATVDVDEAGAVLVLVDLEAFEVDELPTGEGIGGLLQLETEDGILRTEVHMEVPWVGAGTPVRATASPLFGAAENGASFSSTVPAEGGGAAGGFATMLLMAFLGGLLLNIMPCVLPVLTLKLYGLIEQVDVGTRERRVAGIAYSAGIVVSFLALAAGVIACRVLLGESVLWGFQFQYPAYVAALATIVWVFGLSLFGIFEVPALGATQVSEASDKEGAAGYFLTGVFATLLATPCSAPFLGTGMGFAFSLPSYGILLFFGVAGLGLAFPFLIIALVPALYRFLPRPGAWMETFKELMGFTLVATALWLTDVLMGQVGTDGGIGFLAFLLVVSMGIWVMGKWGGPTESRKRQLVALAVAVGMSVGGGKMFLDLEMATDPIGDSGALSTDLDFSEAMPWQAFSEARVEELAGTPVFVDFTADWCLTCKVNEKTVLETATVRMAMAELGVVPLKADWTRKDEVISRWLQRYGKAGVPFYLVIPADRSKPNDALGEVITPEGVVEALRRATN